MTTNNINSNNLKFADYLKDSPFIMFIVSLLYGLSLYLYFNFRLNPEWGGGVGDDECSKNNMKGCTAERAIELEKENEIMGYKPSWWDVNKMHLMDILFCTGAAASLILLVTSWMNILGKDPFKEMQIFKSMFLLLMYLLLIVGLVAGLVFFFSSTPAPLTILTNIITIATIIFLIIFLGKTFSSWFSGIAKSKLQYNTLLGFIYLSITYLPCKLYDVITWLKNQWKITTKTDYILLAISLVLIATRIGIPILWNYLKSKIWGQNILLKGSVPLQYNRNIGVFQGLDPYKVKNKDLFNYNYSISFKIWINPQGEWTNYKYNSNANILDFGNVLLVQYNNDNIKFIASTTRKNNINKHITVYKVNIKNIPLQKWNDFVINYNGGTLDIFINGSLESSTPLITPIMGYHAVTVGDNNGIYGGIKDVVYYKKLLNINDIRNLSIIT